MRDIIRKKRIGDSMYYTEITKIIEAGMDKDREKVKNYARLLAAKLEKDGEERASKRVIEAIDKKTRETSTRDSLMAFPVDQESRMNIIKAETFDPKKIELVLSEMTREKIEDFMATIHYRDRLIDAGLNFNMSLLLYGVPGCGKTSLAQYIASKLELPLVTARLDTLVSSLLGNTAKNLRRIFEYAASCPCVLFLDEFDAIAKARDDKHEMGELKRVVNSLLQNIDEYCQEGILIAATNHQELLDSAIWRRFQTIVEVPAPSIKEIERYIVLLLGKMENDILADKKKHTYFCDALCGLSYSDIRNIVQNLIKKSLIKNKEKVEFVDAMIEVYLFKNHGRFEMDDIVRYICKHGVTQNNAADYYGVSVRQIRNCLEA